VSALDSDWSMGSLPQQVVPGGSWKPMPHPRRVPALIRGCRRDRSARDRGVTPQSASPRTPKAIFKSAVFLESHDVPLLTPSASCEGPVSACKIAFWKTATPRPALWTSPGLPPPPWRARRFVRGDPGAMHPRRVLGDPSNTLFGRAGAPPVGTNHRQHWLTRASRFHLPEGGLRERVGPTDHGQPAQSCGGPTPWGVGRYSQGRRRPLRRIHLRPGDRGLARLRR